MKLILKNIFMDTSKQTGKRKFRFIFYFFCVGILFNLIWITLPITDKVWIFLGIDDVKLRDFVGPIGYYIILLILFFNIFYYVLTKKKLYGFELLLILSFFSLIIIPIYIILTNNFGIQPH